MALITEIRENTSPHYLPAAKVPQERVLFALSARERSQLFPLQSDDFFNSNQNSWIDPELIPSPQEWEQHLREIRPTLLVSCWSTHPIPTRLLFTEALPLRYVCHATGSVKNIVPREFLVGGGIITNWGSLVSHAVAEHALLLILASLRRLPRWREMVRTRTNWGGVAGLLKTQTLRGKKVGIHGFGGIACELVQLLGQFDVECTAFSEGVPQAYMKKMGAIPSTDLRQIFRESDIVVECEALTPKTIGSVTEAHLQLMPQDAIFVNVGRGAVVDETALASLVSQGRIRVASDVFQTEPLPKDSPLRHLDDVLISPHIAGPTDDLLPQCGEIVLKNIARYGAGYPLEGQVTLEIYDRST